MSTIGRDQRVAIVLQTILDKPCADLSVAALAEVAGLSPLRLAHLFKLVTGTSLEAHVRRQRIDTATASLTATSLSVKEVAAKSGFVNARHFARVCRLIRGCSPTAIRRQQKQTHIRG